MGIRTMYYRGIEKKIYDRIEEVEDILYATPAADIIKLRAEAFLIMEENQDDNKRMRGLLVPLAKREKELLEITAKQDQGKQIIEELDSLGKDLREVLGKIKALKK